MHTNTSVSAKNAPHRPIAVTMKFSNSFIIKGALDESAQQQERQTGNKTTTT